MSLANSLSIFFIFEHCLKLSYPRGKFRDRDMSAVVYLGGDPRKHWLGEVRLEK